MALHMAVVGGRGWLGRAIVDAARRRHLTVTVVSRQPGPGTVAADPADTASLAAALHRADVVVNAAGYRGADPGIAAVANSELPDKLGWLSAQTGWRLVHLGSAAEYGPSAAGAEPITEDRPCVPTSVYGTSKLAGTRAVLRWRSRGAQALVARVFNVVDHDLPPENPFHGIAVQVRQAALSEGSGEVGVGDPTTQRDVGCRRTLAEAIVALAATAPPATTTYHPVVNICTGQATSFADLADAMARQLDVPITVRDLGWPRGGRIVGDASLLRALVTMPRADRLDDLARSILGLASPSPELTGDHR
jgi:nucleoside-diphosphate-sugar epimerase